MIPLLRGFSLGGHPLKAKWWEDYLLHIRSADLFASYFWSYPSSYYSLRNLHLHIIHREIYIAALLTLWPRTQDLSYYQLNITLFSALSKLLHNLIIPAVAFTTEAWQFWDLLSALFTQRGMLLLQKISLFNLGVHISPQFCGISNFSCNCLILPNFSGSYVQCFLITDANLSDIASPRFWEIWCSWSTWQGLGRIMTTRNFCRSVGTTIIVYDGSFLANCCSITIIFCTIF